MSTKATIAYGDNFHLYEEVFDEDNIYLELDNVAFEASPNRVVVPIPVAIWEVIRRYRGIDLSWADKTDQELQQYVEKQVDERIQKYEDSKGDNQGLMRFAGVIAYGKADEPRQQQIDQGIAYFQQLREHQQQIQTAIAALEKTNRQP